MVGSTSLNNLLGYSGTSEGFPFARLLSATLLENGSSLLCWKMVHRYSAGKWFIATLLENGSLPLVCLSHHRMT